MRHLGDDWGALAGRPVSDVMTRNVVSVSRFATVADVMERMTEKRIRHMPIVENGELVGIVSIGDVVKRKIEETEQEAIALKEYIAADPLPSTCGALSKLSKASSGRNLAGRRRGLGFSSRDRVDPRTKGASREAFHRPRRARCHLHQPRCPARRSRRTRPFQSPRSGDREVHRTIMRDGPVPAAVPVSSASSAPPRAPKRSRSPSCGCRIGWT